MAQNMNQIFTWIKTVSAVLIVLSLFKNLLPGKQYERYLNAFLGMLVVYVLFEPWSAAGSLQEVIVDGIFTLENGERDIYEPEELEAFSYHMTASEYERMLRLQIADAAENAGLDIADVQVDVEDDQNDTYGVIKNITLVCASGTCEEQAIAVFVQQLSDMLGMNQENIIVQ